MDSLPPEIRNKILLKLDDKKDIYSISQVSKSWYESSQEPNFVFTVRSRICMGMISSPEPFRVGLRKNQMSSCFLLTEADDLNSLLYSGEDDMGMISKLQEPIGVSLSNIRHSNIFNIRNSEKSSCVLPFGVIYEIITCVNEEVKKKLYQIIIDF